MPSKKLVKKKVAATPAHLKKSIKKKVTNPLFERRPRNFRIGGDILHETDLTHFVKWPKYIRIQRQKAVLAKRLKIPPSINQFRQTLDKNNATTLFKLFTKYSPESAAAKKERLAKEAEAKKDGKKVEQARRPNAVIYGIKDVTRAIESKKASFVAIAFDVDPIEIALFLPALCRKFDVPYVIVKDKSRLGTVVGKKTTSTVAFTKVNPEDQAQLASLQKLPTITLTDVLKTLRETGEVLSCLLVLKQEKINSTRVRPLN
uniref:60S ribosomal protein L7a n=1 Tax=Arion vulgaris TaxID=1028688 RepID=A0A0B6YA84_9EUPU